MILTRIKDGLGRWRDSSELGDKFWELYTLVSDN